jgi:hypothetical protein
MNSEKPLDQMLLGPQVTPDGGRTFIRRQPNQMSGGICRPLKHGEALMGDVVQLQRVEGDLYNVVENLPSMTNLRPSIDPRPPIESRASGPAMVSSDAYRSGWENVFGAKKAIAQA